jgi:hypothetical protein
MFRIFLVAALCVSALCGARAADAPARVAVAIVYDTSGSMRDAVRDSSGRRAPKYVIGNRALEALVGRIEAFQKKESSGAAPAKPILAGLVIFSGNGAQEVLKIEAFQPEKFRTWARNFKNPNGATPLGAAVETAGNALLAANAETRHTLVITDGMNTAGPDPASVIARLNKTAEAKNTALFFHFIAFDVNANVFAPIKKQGATVVAAADEQQLNGQLEFILEEKILLEREEPKKK